MAGSSGKQTGILGRLRNKRDRRHERRAEKGRVEAKRQYDERSREREGNAAGGKGLCRRRSSPATQPGRPGVRVLRRLPPPAT